MRNILHLLISSLLITELFTSPFGGNVVSGNVEISEIAGTTYLEQSTDKAIIQWDSFSIGDCEAVNALQPSTSAAILNRVIGGDSSIINGTIKATGEFYLINPNGIIIGPGGIVNAGSFIASTLDLTNEDFLADNDKLFFGSSIASIENNGRIENISNNVFLIARQVVNNRTIDAGNKVCMAAGTEVFLYASEDDILVQVAGEGLADQSGMINAQIAEVRAAGGNIGPLAINCIGAITSNKKINKSGDIYIVAEDGTVEFCSHCSTNLGDNGGKIHILGDYINIRDGSTIDVSAALAGGELLIGGDYQGNNPEIKNALELLVEKKVNINANCTDSGNGGKVILWSDNKTSYYGNVTAQGGIFSGDGGFVEISGGDLIFEGTVSTKAFHGQYGQLLLDPCNITINASASDPTFTFTPPYPDPAEFNPNSSYASATLNVSNLNTALNNTNVIIKTIDGFGGDGDVTLSAVTISWSAPTTLTIEADRDITFQPGSQIENTYSGVSPPSNFLFLDAGRNINTYADITWKMPSTLIMQAVGTVDFSAGTILQNAYVGATPPSDFLLLSSGGVVTIRNNVTSYQPATCGIYSDHRMNIASTAVIENKYTGSTSNWNAIDINAKGIVPGDYHGLLLSGKVISEEGNIVIEGHGSGLTGSTKMGIWFTGSNAEVSSVGTGTYAATIDFIGYGGTTNQANHGIYCTSGGVINSKEGKITLTGTGGGDGFGGGGNYGLFFNGVSIISFDDSLPGAHYDADIEINGNGGNGDGGNHGFRCSNALIKCQVGSIAINGTGGGAGEDNYGVYLNSANALIESIGVGSITLTGTQLADNLKDNYGIYSYFGPQIKSSGGDISFIGKGRGTTSNNTGVYLYKTNITATADAGIIIDGIGNFGEVATTSSNFGIRLYESSLTSVNGDITISGESKVGTGPTSINNPGIIFQSSSSLNYNNISSSGTGSIEIRGIGGGSTDDNHGMNISNANIESNSGFIKIIGTGGGDGNDNDGLLFNNVHVLADSGNITLKGTSSEGSSRCLGISLIDSDIHSTNSGIRNLIKIEGTGKGAVAGNSGINFDSSYILGDADTNIEVTGLGGQHSTVQGSSTNRGLYFTNSSIETLNGSITVVGRGKGYLSSNVGIQFYNGSKIESLGTDPDATISITGISEESTFNAAGQDNYGIYFITDCYIKSSKHDVNVTGKSFSHNQEAWGGWFRGGSYIESDGIGADAATLTILGEGSPNGNLYAYGFAISGTGVQNSSIKSIDGKITITGTGKGKTTAERSYGVRISANGEIRSLGIGPDYAADIEINGSGGLGTSANAGLSLATGGRVTSDHGNITINCTSLGTTDQNYGVYSVDSTVILSSYGDIEINGTGGPGTDNNAGVYLIDGDVSTVVTDGSIIINGTAQGTGIENYGIFFSTDTGLDTSEIFSINHLTLHGCGSAGAEGIKMTYANLDAINNLVLKCNDFDYDEVTSTLAADTLYLYSCVDGGSIGIGFDSGFNLNIPIAQLNAVITGIATTLQVGEEAKGSFMIFGDGVNPINIDRHVILRGNDVDINSPINLGDKDITCYIGETAASALNIDNVVTTTGTFNVFGGDNTDEIILSIQDQEAVVDGGAGSNILHGPPLGNWYLTGPNEGTVNNVTFTNIHNLLGYEGQDTFAAALGASLSGIINDKGGNNTLLGGERSNWNITGINSGNLEDLVFQNIQNLSGGDLDDTFIFADGASVEGLVNGGDGYNILDMRAYNSPVYYSIEDGYCTGTGGIQNIDEVLTSNKAEMNDIANDLFTEQSLGMDENVFDLTSTGPYDSYYKTNFFPEMEDSEETALIINQSGFIEEDIEEKLKK